MAADSELREALDAAADEARRAGHTYIGTEHLLLGVLRQEGAEAVRLLASYGITYDAVHGQLAAIFSLDRSNRLASPSVDRSPKLTPPAAHAVDVAEARAPGSTNISHLTAALLADRDGLSAGVIEAFGLARGLPRHELAATLERRVLALIGQG